MDLTQGMMRKLVNKVKMFQKSIFPASYYIYHRDSGNLKIYSEDRKKLKHLIVSSEILSVKKGMTTHEQDFHKKRAEKKATRRD